MEAARGGSRGCAMDGRGTGIECAVRSGGPPSSGADVADSGRALGAELATCCTARCHERNWRSETLNAATA